MSGLRAATKTAEPGAHARLLTHTHYSRKAFNETVGLKECHGERGGALQSAVSPGSLQAWKFIHAMR